MQMKKEKEDGAALLPADPSAGVTTETLPHRVIQATNKHGWALGVAVSCNGEIALSAAREAIRIAVELARERELQGILNTPTDFYHTLYWLEQRLIGSGNQAAPEHGAVRAGALSAEKENSHSEIPDSADDPV